MSDYSAIETSPEVYAVIRARYPDMVVFGSFSDPCGEFSGGRKGEMFTSWGFEGQDFPSVEMRTTWEIDREKPCERINQQSKFWICVGRAEQ